MLCNQRNNLKIKLCYNFSPLGRSRGEEIERICSKLGGGLDKAIVPVDSSVAPVEGPYSERSDDLLDMVQRSIDCVNLTSVYGFLHFEIIDHLKENYRPEPDLYFYHSDHLGSSSFITDANGIVSQHLQYLPYGELFAEQRDNTARYYTPYKFSGKEKDEETGYSYFGARYYMPELSIWSAVDPMTDERSWLSPYNYCQNNPVMLTDPDGMLDGDPTDFGVKNNGDIVQIGPTNNEPDKLYAINDDGTKKSNTKPITVNDKELLPSLTKTNPEFKQPMYPDPFAVERKTYDPKTKTWTSKILRTMLQGHYGISKSKSDAKKIFTFVASNSNVEWSLAGFKNGDWIVGTLHQNAQAPSLEEIKGYSFNSLIYDAHSHPNNTATDFRASGNDINRANLLKAVNPNSQSWLFMPKNPKTKWQRL